jgi:hypothetical protein
MIGHCFNPACHRELHYLRQGSVYHWEYRVNHQPHSEFFWLCPSCSSRFKMTLDSHGSPMLAAKGAKSDHDTGFSRMRRVLRGVVDEDRNFRAGKERAVA